MAVLVRSFLSIGRNSKLLKETHLSLMTTKKASFLHADKTSKTPNICVPLASFEQKGRYQPVSSICEKFSPSVNNVPLTLPNLSSGKGIMLDLPSFTTVPALEMPTSDIFLDNAHIMPVKIRIEEPDDVSKVEKWAVRELVVRKHKMKKHRRKKFYKKTRITYARIRLARKMLKEKNLQLELIERLNVGRNFSPQKYANDILCAAYEKIELPPMHPKKKPWEM